MSSDDEAPSSGRRDPGARGVGVGTGVASYGLDDEDLVELRRGAPQAKQGLTLRRALFRILAVALVFLVIAGSGVAYVRLATRSHRHGAEDAPAARIAIVFGAGLQPDGSPSPMLSDRIELAADLYEEQLVSKLLLTGGEADGERDEVQVMHDGVVARGVPTEDVTLDRSGFDTYDSCYRAEAIFDVQQALIITQRYHLARAVYTCRQVGIDAEGVGAKDWGQYNNVMPRHEVREVFSTLKALVELHVIRPKPYYLGPKRPINEPLESAQPARRD